MKRQIVTSAVLAAVVTVTAVAETEPDLEAQAPRDKAQISVGAGAVVSSQPYIGAGARVIPVPMVGYEGRRLYLRGVALGYRLLAGQNWSVGPVLWPRFDGYEQRDSTALQGMADRDMSLDAGVAFALRGQWGLFGASLTTDVLGRHGGQELQLRYALPIRRGKWTIAPSVGVHIESSSLVDYYYGVRPSEARRDRLPYKPDEAVNPFVALRLQRSLGKKWTVLGALQFKWLDSEISDSPIIDEDYDISFITGLLYTF